MFFPCFTIFFRLEGHISTINSNSYCCPWSIMPHYFRDSTITTLMLISITSMVFRIVGIRPLSFNELLSHGPPF